MLHFSEYVSLGHPDKIADYISQYLLDRYIEQDLDTRYAVEVQIKDYEVTLGGEVSSKAHFSKDEIANHVRRAVTEIGYHQGYVNVWGATNAICGAWLNVESHIGQQSPDIAQGLTGWGDQGIFFGYAEPNFITDGMPLDHTLAKRLNKALFESGIGGLDIKTQVVMEDRNLRKAIIAIPLLYSGDTDRVANFARDILQANGQRGQYDIIVNGTGSYVRHSSMADCGTTGRKLAVDFYGGNCRIGGGSPWTKDASKADLSLNLYARWLAKRAVEEYSVAVNVAISFCIGQQDVNIIVTDLADSVLETRQSAVDPLILRSMFGLDKPIYADMCRWGLFGEYQSDKGWERP